MSKILIDEATVTLAIEALKQIDDAMPFPVAKLAQAALREALAEQPAQQEFVAWMHEWEDGERIPLMYSQDDRNDDNPKSIRPLVYGDTTPQPAQRKPLTVAEVEQILAQHNYEIHGDRARYIVRMTEAAHGIKENT